MEYKVPVDGPHYINYLFKNTLTITICIKCKRFDFISKFTQAVITLVIIISKISSISAQYTVNEYDVILSSCNFLHCWLILHNFGGLLFIISIFYAHSLPLCVFKLFTIVGFNLQYIVQSRVHKQIIIIS